MVDEVHESCRFQSAQTLANTGPERIVMARQQLQLVYAALDELPVGLPQRFHYAKHRRLDASQNCRPVGCFPGKSLPFTG